MSTTDSKAKNGRFFAIDGNMWPLVCSLGLNPAVAYLVLARGTGKNNCTTIWSAKSIEKYTSIARHRAPIAIQALIEKGFIKASTFKYGKEKRPKYEIVVTTGCQKKPAWIWLPNEIVTSAAGEDAPVELLWQTDNIGALRLFIELYAGHLTAEDGGIHHQKISRAYSRKQLGERGPAIVWGFVPEIEFVWPTTSFVKPYRIKDPKPGEPFVDQIFWKNWHLIVSLGLVTEVPHLLTNDTSEAEIYHPMPYNGSGMDVENALAEAACLAGRALLSDGKLARADYEMFQAIAPIPVHRGNIQMRGIYRLRYLPKTTANQEFVAKSDDWRRWTADYQQIAATPDMRYQYTIKRPSKGSQ